MPTIDLSISPLGERGFSAFGDGSIDLGAKLFRVSFAGDINGDGFDDFILGSPPGDYAYYGGEQARGVSYVIFGSATDPGSIDLEQLTLAEGFRIFGDQANDRAGYVSAAGDVNGDGFDDLIVGAPGNDAAGPNAGAAYVIFGKASGFADLDLSAFSASDGFVIRGDADGDALGTEVASAGDVNGDGIDDLVVSAISGDDGGADAGEVYVVFGKAGASRADLDLTTLAASDGFVIQGASAGDRIELRSAPADVNGDGFDDLIVVTNYGGTDDGEVHVVFGRAGAFGTADGAGRQVVDLATPPGAGGFVILGNVNHSGFGYGNFNAASAGDVNGDGFDDIVIGVPQASENGTDSGAAYVVFGKAGGFGTIDLAALDPSDGFAILGRNGSDNTGHIVAGAGDINGDGFDDVMIAAYGAEGGPAIYDGYGGVYYYDRYGAVYVIYGKSGGFGTIDLETVHPDDALIIRGRVSYDQFGFDISAAGDFNADGLDDFLVITDTEVQGGAAPGYVTLFYGRDVPQTIDLRSDAMGGGGATISGDAVGDRTGSSVASAGDFNGDGYADVVIGAPGAGGGAGEAYLLLGRAGGLASFEIAALGAGDGFVITGGVGDAAGSSVSSAGDVNGDGFDDLIVGAPGGDGGAGEVYVIFGKAGGFGPIDLSSLAAADGFVIQGDAAGDALGTGVAAAGDIDGDGIDDLIIGAPGNDAGGSGAGAAYVIFGRSGPRATIDLSALAAADGFAIQGADAFDRAGISVTSAGDFNGDGFDDVIIGAPVAGSYAGAAYVVFGKADGFGAIDLSSLGSAGFVIQGHGAGGGEYAGRSVASAGDINGDGFDDLIIGAPYGDEDNLGRESGEAFVIFGRAAAPGSIDLSSLSAADGFNIQGDAGSDATGYAVAGAGDFNGDGFDDFLVAAPRSDLGGFDSGATYLVFGRAGGFGTIDLQTLAASEGLVIQGPLRERAGLAVAAAGDVNGDGFADLIVGAPGTYESGYYGDYDTDGAAYIIYGKSSALAGSPGNDNLTGTPVGELINLSQGGDDTAFGLDGDDGFYFGGAFTSADNVDGGDGDLDQVGLQGDYSAGLIFGANSFVNVEMLVLLPGNDSRFGDNAGNFYSYDLTTVDANVAAGETFRVSFNQLRAGENVTFDGSAETNGAFLTFGGLGVDDLTGGAGNDGFYFGTGRFGAGDVLSGGAGTLDQLGLQGDYSGANAIVFGAGQLAGIEMIVCLTAADARFNGNGAALYDYDLTMDEGNVADGGLLMVSANTLIAGESLSFDASAETGSGRYTVWSGGGDDSLAGGAGIDTLYGGGGADTLTGGGGNDVFGYSSAADSTAAALDAILDFALGDTIDLAAIDANTGAGGDQAFSFIGAAAFGNVAGELRAVLQSGADWLVEADTNGDGIADFAIAVTTDHALTGTDFVL